MPLSIVSWKVALSKMLLPVETWTATLPFVLRIAATLHMDWGGQLLDPELLDMEIDPVTFTITACELQ